MSHPTVAPTVTGVPGGTPISGPSGGSPDRDSNRNSPKKTTSYGSDCGLKGPQPQWPTITNRNPVTVGSPRQPAEHIPEADWQATVVDLARLAEWAVYHTRDSRGSEPGFPDLVLVRPPRLVVAELKTARGKLRREQRVWLHLLAGVPGVEVKCWRPADWADVVATLTPPPDVVP